MPYVIRRATRDDIDALVRHTLDMAVETEGRVLDGAALSRGMHVTFDRPNLADYYVAVCEEESAASDEERAATPTEASPMGASDSERGSPTNPTAPASAPTGHAAVRKPSEVVGFMMTTREFKPLSATTVQLLQTVYIAPQHRRHGLFRCFYEHIKAEVEADPACEGIWLYVEEENTAAIHAYQRVGMRREDTHMKRWSKTGF